MWLATIDCSTTMLNSAPDHMLGKYRLCGQYLRLLSDRLLDLQLVVIVRSPFCRLRHIRKFKIDLHAE